MGRKSTGRPAGRPPSTVAGVAAKAVEVFSFAPSNAQIEAKSNFWAMWRQDPLADPAYLKPGEIAQRAGCPEVMTWLADRSFRDWFLNKDERTQKLEYAYDLLTGHVVAELERGGLETKDLALLAKVLIDMRAGAGRGRAAGDDGDGQKQLTPEQAREIFHKTALRMGYVLATPADPQLDAVPSPTESK